MAIVTLAILLGICAPIVNSLIVATFNVESGFTTAQKQQEVAAYLTEVAGADVFVLTEVTKASELANVAKLMGEHKSRHLKMEVVFHSAMVASSGDNTGGVHVGIIYDKYFTVQKAYFAPELKCRNIVVEAKPLFGPDFVVIGVHLKSSAKRKMASNVIRLEQIKNIIGYVNAKKWKDVLVVGDINEQAADPNGAIKALEAGGFHVVEHEWIDYILASTNMMKDAKFIGYALPPAKTKITGYKGNHAGVAGTIVKKPAAHQEYKAYYGDVDGADAYWTGSYDYNQMRTKQNAFIAGYQPEESYQPFEYMLVLSSALIIFAVFCMVCFVVNLMVGFGGYLAGKAMNKMATNYKESPYHQEV